VREIFLNVNPRCSNYSALLPTTPKIFQYCCPQRRKLIGIVAYNAVGNNKEKCSNFHVCFSAPLHTTPIIFPRCKPQRGKMIGIVAYTAEKLSVLLTTTRKNV
jgi:hypothetical protein